jgi:hypothetical protein
LRNNSRIEVDDDFRASIEDSGDRIPLRDWVKTFLSTDRGRRLLPAKKNPSTAGVPSTTAEPPGSKRKVTRADMLAGKVTTEEIRKGRVVIID